MISVVIPSYNYAHFLPQAVKSVAMQTYLDIELVIVDDASQDGSAEVINELIEQHGKRFSNTITILNHTNKGAHATINEGIRAATGEWVAVLNADDLYEAERFSSMMECMGAARMAFSAVRCIDAQGQPAHTQQAHDFEAVQHHIEGKRFMALAAVGENVAISTGNLLFQKSLFQELDGFKNYKYVHDYDFLLRACLLAEPVFVPETKYLYRLHGENTFTKLAKEGLRENRMVWLDFYYAIRKMQVKNSIMLQNADYVEEVHAAVYALGKKKETLWQISTNIGVRALMKQLKRNYAVEA